MIGAGVRLLAHDHGAEARQADEATVDLRLVGAEIFEHPDDDPELLTDLPH